jgi:hypothetical protein
MFIFSTTSFSTEIENLHFVINNNFQKSFNINPTYIQSIPENDNSELITSIIKTDENWKRLLSVEKGFTNEKFLLKIPIKNKQENKQFTLLLDWHYIDFATLYYKNKLGEIKEVSTLGEFTKKKRNISFSITIDKDETIDFYIKVNSTGHVRLPIHLFTEEYYSQRENLHNIIYGAFIGIMILIMIYNIIAFTKLKLKLFVPYILFIFFEVFFGSILTGHISHLKLPPIVINNSFNLFSMLCMGSALWFFNLVLEVKKTSINFYWIINSFAIFSFVMAFFTLFIDVYYSTFIVSVSSCTFIAFAIFVNIYLIFKKVKNSFSFLLAWSTVVLSAIIINLRNLGFIHNSPILSVEIINLIGVGISSILLTLIVSNYLKIILNSLDEIKLLSKAKDEFLATMSHEIRTPMNGVIGMTELLEETNLNEEQKEYTKKINQCGKSLLTLINDVLDLSKINSGKLIIEKTPFNLKEEIQDIISLYNIQNKKENINIELDYPKILPVDFIGDPLRIRQIIFNFISNSYKFTNKGTILITVTYINKNITVSVKDTGIGIPKNKIKKLFESFSQVDQSTTRKYGGTGLGLSISKKIAEAMSGEVGAQSTINKGSIFWVKIPLDTFNRPKENNEKKKKNKKLKNNKDLKILVAEDNKVNQMIIKKHLTNLNIDYELVENGKEAVDYCANHRVDLIFMDIQMPVKDGYQATVEIKNIHPHIKIIGISANALSEQKDKAISIGMDGYITKPFKKDDLILMLNRHLKNKIM